MSTKGLKKSNKIPLKKRQKTSVKKWEKHVRKNAKSS